jgi:uncharacterized protein (DUF1800 family)
MQSKSLLNSRRFRRLIPAIVPVLAGSLLVQASFASLAPQRASKKSSSMTGDQRIAHALSRLTFGARPGDFEKVKAMGVEAFIDQQLDPDSIDNTAVIAKLRKLATLNMATPVIIDQYTPPKPVALPSPPPPKPAEISSPEVKTAAYSLNRTPQLSTTPGTAAMQNEMSAKPEDAGKMPAVQTPVPTASPKPTPPPKNPQMVVTDLQRGKLLRAVYSDRQLYELMADFWENHFSIFANKDDDRYLLTSFDRETIRPFAMGRFRDLLGATAHSPAMLFYLDNWRSSVPRPYPAKDGKPAGVDGGLNENYARELMELHTLGVDGGYTQKDVQEVARCFSGWTIEKPNAEGLFLYRPGLHDDGEKLVLGHKILAGGGIADGERVLDILATHPSTARFIATKLARRFISDDPPPAVIDRAAAVFLKTDGSIRETLRAIITSPEFFSTTAYRAKVRSPFEYAAAALRATAAETDGDRPVLDFISRMGQPLFGRITPDGYSDRAEQWLSSGAMVARLNFAAALATNRLKGTRIDPANVLSGVDLTKKDEVASRLMQIMLTGDASAQTHAALEKVWKPEPVAILPATQNQTPTQNQVQTYPFPGYPPEFSPLNTSRPGKPQIPLVPPTKFVKGGPNAIPNSYIVVLNDDVVSNSAPLQLRHDTIEAIANAHAAAHSGKVGYIYATVLKGYSIMLPTEADAIALSNDPQVKWVEANSMGKFDSAGAAVGPVPASYSRDAQSPPPSADYVSSLMALLIGSPEFQRR